MNRRAVVIAFAAAAGLLLLWFVALWGPQGGALSKAKDRASSAEADNSALEVQLSRLQAAQAEAPKLMATLDKLRRAVPDDPQLAQFILDANQAASDAGVDFLSISPAVPEQAGTLPPVIKLSISVTGDYFSVLDYLDRLDNLDRIVVIDDLSLTPSDENGQQRLGVSITARMFATSAPQIAGAAGAAPTAAAGGSTTTTSSTTVPTGSSGG